MKLYNYRNHKIVLLNNRRNNNDDVELNTKIINSVTTNGYLTDLEKEENWISFNSNLNHLRIEDRKFTTAVHENKASKFIVAYSKDKGYMDNDRLNKYLDKEVTLIIDTTKLFASLKPKENQILIEIIKSVKEITEQ